METSFADWSNFFVAEAGASAALVGLVAVAISINLARILEYPQLTTRAAETLFTLTLIFVLASLALIPGQPSAIFGAESIVAGVLALAVSARAQAMAWGAPGAPSTPKRVARAAAALASNAPLLVGGLMLAAGSPPGRYWIAAGVVGSLAASIWNAWILLVEILR